LQAADDLSDAVVEGLEGNSPYCWRVRYRDRGLRWSPWSVPAGFTTGDSALSANLLLNPGAEQGIEHWTVTEGVLESLTSGECDGREPYDGDRYFAVGGLCEGESDYGEARQTVQLKEWLADVQAGRVRAHFGGMLRDWGGDDRPEIRLDFVDAVGSTLDQSETLGLQATEWTEVSSALDVPVGAQAVDFVMMGTRNAGDDNDSYLDEVRLRLEVVTEEPSAGDDDDTTGDDDATGNEDDGDPSGGEATDGPALVSGVGDCAGCGIAPRADALGWLPTSLVVGLWVSTRRRRRLRPASVVPPSPRVPLQ
ncbi:MAG: hypothetical protein CL928_01225, partial [Deltaproteobacteria bacterium]|nr:hypothetical protein [Deltaproteobacteria bacterium]